MDNPKINPIHKFILFLFILLPAWGFTQQVDVMKDSTISYQFTSPTDSMRFIKSRFNYNAQGKITLNAKFIWNQKKNDWTGDYKYEYSYDMDLNLTINYLAAEPRGINKINTSSRSRASGN